MNTNIQRNNYTYRYGKKCLYGFPSSWKTVTNGNKQNTADIRYCTNTAAVVDIRTGDKNNNGLKVNSNTFTLVLESRKDSN